MMSSLRANLASSRRGTKLLTAITAPLAVLALATSSLVAVPAAQANDLDKAKERERQAAIRVQRLRTELSGIDASLAESFIKLDSIQQQIPSAEEELAQAQVRRDAAEREHFLAEEALSKARRDLAGYGQDIVAAESQQVDLTRTIGGLARHMYRGGVTSPMVMVLTAEGTEEIGKRAAAAEVLAKTQDKALEAARETETIRRNQGARQEAITERITTLEATAREAAAAAKIAENDANAKVNELNALREQERKQQAAWDAQRATAEKQMEQAKREEEALSKEVARLEAEAQAALEAMRRAQEEEARKRAAQAAQQAQARLNAARNSQAQAQQNTANAKAKTPAPISASPAPRRGILTSPVPNIRVTAPWGTRIHPIFGRAEHHKGVDLGGACGTPLFAAANGIVTASRFSSSAGNMVIIAHGNIGGKQISTVYFHMQVRNVSVGQHVSAGQVIGTLGTTGWSTGCHLHFEVHENGRDVNPMRYL